MSLSTTLRRALTALEDRPRQYSDLIEEMRREIEKLEQREAVKVEKTERRPAVAGERFLWRQDGVDLELTVYQKADGQEGRWLCLSCGVVCEHQLDRDLHCKTQGLTSRHRRMKVELGDVKARHVLGWRNFATGHVEEP